MQEFTDYMQNEFNYVEPTCLFVQKMSRMTESKRVQQMKEQMLKRIKDSGQKLQKTQDEVASLSLNRFKDGITQQ